MIRLPVGHRYYGFPVGEVEEMRRESREKILRIRSLHYWKQRQFGLFVSMPVHRLDHYGRVNTQDSHSTTSPVDGEGTVYCYPVSSSCFNKFYSESSLKP